MLLKRTPIFLAVIGHVVSLFAASAAFADDMVFIKDYTYVASDIDSKVSCRAIALQQVKRALLEQLGTYLINETQVRNFQITKDQVTTLTAGIVSAEIVDERWDGRTYYLKAKISADPEEVARSVDALQNDKKMSDELEETRKRAEDAMREVERLKKEVNARGKGREDYNIAVKKLRASDWVFKGNAFLLADNYKYAIDAYSKAIELNPQYASAYTSRGNAYEGSGDYQQAIKDYNKAIELNPRYDKAYIGRGIAYSRSGDNQQAMKDYNRAIELNPRNSITYYNISCMYSLTRKLQEACGNLKTAISLGYKNWDHIKKDKDFSNLRQSSCYREIMSDK